jgi:hypothetical protein
MPIRNPAYVHPINLFDGLSVGTGGMTDIDGFSDYHGKGFIVVEMKYAHAKVPDGQRWALELYHDNMSRVKPCLTIIATHRLDNRIAKAMVSELRYVGGWAKVSHPLTVQGAINLFVDYIDRRL